MASRLICNPAEHPAILLLALIQGTPDAFTEGRRNNDLVNWFIAKRLIDIEAGVATDEAKRLLGGVYEQHVEDTYISDFNQLMTQVFNPDQRAHLNGWNERWRTKILRLVQAYGHITGPEHLYHLWLPMDYDDGVHANQQVIPGTSVPV